MAWIDWVPEEDASGRLKELYQQHSGRFGVDHILKIHSLNPSHSRGTTAITST
jgi:hypothetical protein